MKLEKDEPQRSKTIYALTNPHLIILCNLLVPICTIQIVIQNISIANFKIALIWSGAEGVQGDKIKNYSRVTMGQMFFGIGVQ